MMWELTECGKVLDKHKTLIFEHFEDGGQLACLIDSKVIYFLPNTQIKNPRKTKEL